MISIKSESKVIYLKKHGDIVENNLIFVVKIDRTNTIKTVSYCLIQEMKHLVSKVIFCDKIHLIEYLLTFGRI